MRSAVLLLLVAACSKPAPDPNAGPVYEWISRGRTSDREVTTRVMAGNRDEAMALAKEKYPDLVAPPCTPNPRR